MHVEFFRIGIEYEQSWQYHRPQATPAPGTHRYGARQRILALGARHGRLYPGHRHLDAHRARGRCLRPYPTGHDAIPGRGVHPAGHMGHGPTATLLGRRPQPRGHRRDGGRVDSTLAPLAPRRDGRCPRLAVVGTGGTGAFPLLRHGETPGHQETRPPSGGLLCDGRRHSGWPLRHGGDGGGQGGGGATVIYIIMYGQDKTRTIHLRQGRTHRLDGVDSRLRASLSPIRRGGDLLRSGQCPGRDGWRRNQLQPQLSLRVRQLEAQEEEHRLALFCGVEHQLGHQLGGHHPAHRTGQCPPAHPSALHDSQVRGVVPRGHIHQLSRPAQIRFQAKGLRSDNSIFSNDRDFFTQHQR